MELRERLRTPIADAVREAEREGEERVITLLEQGYTLEQIKQMHSQGAKTQTRQGMVIPQ